MKFEILDTDYKTYSVVYREGVNDVEGQSWILTRSALDLDKDKQEISRIREIANQIL